MEDIAQDVFVQVHRKAGTFEGRSSVKTWLYAVAINVCRDHQRHERRAPPARRPSTRLEPLVPTCPTPRSTRSSSWNSRNAPRWYARRSMTLTPAHRTVLYLRDHEDMSYDQIAGALGVPLGTVRSRLHNARATLADALGRRVQAMRGLTR